MKRLTAKEFVTLPKKEQEKRIKELDSHEQFLLRTMYTIPKSIIVGQVELTEEQKEKAHQDLLDMLKEDGIL